MHKTFVCILYIKCTVNSHEVCPLNSTWPASTFLLPTRPHFLRVHQHSKHIIPVFCHQGLDFEQHCPIFSVHLSLIELTFILALYQYFGLTDLVSFMIDFSFNLTLSKPLKTFPSSLFFFFPYPSVFILFITLLHLLKVYVYESATSEVIWAGLRLY